MSIPTQAQIEAAARTLYEASGKTKDWNEIAKSALTAAADLPPGVSSLPAEQERKFLDRLLIDDTIERCAQVADSYNTHGGIEREIAAAIRALKDEP